MSLRASAGSQDQLGGEIGDGADQGPGAGGRSDGAGQAEIAELDPAVVGDQDVLRFDVAVDQACGVGGAEPFDDGVDQGQGPAAGERAPLSLRTSRSVWPLMYSMTR